MITETLRRAWRLTPDDAVRVAIVALMMPLLFMLYQVGPTQLAARVIFSLSVGTLGVLVGWLVQERSDTIGYFIGSCSIGATIAAVACLFVVEDPTWTWRTVMAGSQANLVLGWGILWQVRKKWLSRGLAFWAFAVSAIGFAFYILGNFGLPDPALADPWTWGWTEPKGVLRRTMDLPLEPLLGIALWVAVVLRLRRFLLAHGPG